MNHLHEKAQHIKLLICDLDGVLTDGTILLTHDHQQFYMAFNVQDGLGIKLLQKNGIDVAIITTSPSPIVDIRMQQLGIEHFYKDQQDKNHAYATLLKKLNLKPTQVAYIGDDLPDLDLMRRSGLAIAVANAVPIIIEYADWKTTRSGGRGAVREAADLLLAAQGYSPTITPLDNP